VEHAKKALQRAELQYRDGIISNLDLLDVQTGLTEAQLSELQIAYRNLVSFYQLKKAVGDKVW
ncbi:MAG: TolC family protein, partial [Bacteroidota bacterium]|nr:TolC family protein [Bacteroidota bacterium]